MIQVDHHFKWVARNHHLDDVKNQHPLFSHWIYVWNRYIRLEYTVNLKVNFGGNSFFFIHFPYLFLGKMIFKLTLMVFSKWVGWLKPPSSDMIYPSSHGIIPPSLQKAGGFISPDGRVDGNLVPVGPGGTWGPEKMAENTMEKPWIGSGPPLVAVFCTYLEFIDDFDMMCNLKLSTVVFLSLFFQM